MSESPWIYGHNETIMLTLSTPLLLAIHRYADEQNISRNEAIRRAISQLTGEPDPGNKRRYLNDEEKHQARIERRAARREKRRKERT